MIILEQFMLYTNKKKDEELGCENRTIIKDSTRTILKCVIHYYTITVITITLHLLLYYNTVIQKIVNNKSNYFIPNIKYNYSVYQITVIYVINISPLMEFSGNHTDIYLETTLCCYHVR